MYFVSIGGDMSKAIEDVIVERKRQVEEEGWTHAHDDLNVHGQLPLLAALYALPYDVEINGEKLIKQDDHIKLDMILDIGLGWNTKPEPDQRKRLIKAGALILAEIERLDRLASKK